MLVVRRGAAAQDGERPTSATLGSGRHAVLALAGTLVRLRVLRGALATVVLLVLVASRATHRVEP